MSNDCNVCCEKFNKSNHKLVLCTCDYYVCTSCSENYLLNSSQDIHCMNCKKAWNNEFLHKYFTKKFINNDLKNYRENILYEREKSLLPATQIYVEKQKKINDYTNKIKLLRKDKNSKQNDIHILKLDINNNIEHSKFIIIREKLRNELKELIIIDNDINHYICLCNHIKYNNKEIDERRQFIKACPINECRGFLSTKWNCGLCDCKVCKECHEVINNDEHTCIPENVETAKLISKDSKNCPNCSSLIFKIEGCSQMFCTICFTPFNWNTLKIESGPIHNPHYYELQRQNNGGIIPRTIGDIQCGGLPHYYIFKNKLINLKLSNDNIILFSKLYEFYNHNEAIVIPSYRIDVINDNKDLRIRFMLNEINEERFKQYLQMQEKARQKKTELLMIYQMYQTAISDIMQRIYKEKDSKNIDIFIIEFNNLKIYCNDVIKNIKNRYKCTAQIINDVGKIE